MATFGDNSGTVLHSVFLMTNHQKYNSASLTPRMPSVNVFTHLEIIFNYTSVQLVTFKFPLSEFYIYLSFRRFGFTFFLLVLDADVAILGSERCWVKYVTGFECSVRFDFHASVCLTLHESICLSFIHLL